MSPTTGGKGEVLMTLTGKNFPSDSKVIFGDNLECIV